MKRFEGKTVLITGAASGIGACEAEKFGLEGAKVVAADITKEALDLKVQELKDKGIDIIGVKLDVSSNENWEKVIETVKETYGARIDVLCNTAGICPTEATDEISIETFDKTIAVNLRGAFLGVKNCLPLMKDFGGSIINCSSISSNFAYGCVAYGASKGGLRTMTKYMAKDLGKYNIRVNAVNPGNIMTPMMAVNVNEEILGYVKQASPLGLVGEAEDITDITLFLASEEAKYITGEEINVDGGFTCYK